MANNSAWVLVTGVIRDEQFLVDRFNFLFKLKEKGDIEQVVFSTWIGEIDKFKNIAALIKQYNFVLVASQEPDLICTGHYLHQVVSLKNGLDVCPDDSFILRTRTDKCGPESGFFDDLIESFFEKRNYIRPLEDATSLFSYKVGIQGGHTKSSAEIPSVFFWNDRLYFGYKQDLLKFVNFDILAFDFKKIIPEELLFSYPFLTRYPIFNIFYEAVNQQYVGYHFVPGMGSMTQEFLNTLSESLVSFKVFKYAFLSERFLLHKYFFDINSENDFGFDPHYRGINVINDQETQSYVDSLFSNEQVPRSDNLAQDFNALVDFLTNQYTFTKVIQRDAGLNGYIFDTPRVSATIKEHKPQPETLPLLLRSDDARARTNVGQRSALNIRTTGQRGFLYHGPYIRLDVGDYEISFFGEWSGALTEVDIDIVSDKGAHLWAKKTFNQITRSKQLAVLPFSLTEMCELLEVRIHVADKTNMSIEKVEFKKIHYDSTFEKKSSVLLARVKKNFPLLGKILPV
ncbi:hypothetical protein [Aquirhabdus sp.]|uniref:hypothetical protein n=1 Tax=Aquirhabdus sp. TaxID=2824160 RepID=UPI00396CF91F